MFWKYNWIISWSYSVETSPDVSCIINMNQQKSSSFHIKRKKILLQQQLALIHYYLVTLLFASGKAKYIIPPSIQIHIYNLEEETVYPHIQSEKLCHPIHNTTQLNTTEHTNKVRIIFFLLCVRTSKKKRRKREHWMSFVIYSTCHYQDGSIFFCITPVVLTEPLSYLVRYTKY